ncbi:hypothetical protein [Candidatus Nanobsidianus stetteri]|uniref:Uncharacterized protein n=1 Tax=Nanobsidianus stetteri TaxID=1294122 RepID=A0A2T9WMB3_NANST|nr:hypothetical protein [Candidatus Nanobsidianus stetteri]MCC5446955.1 hypothetical protein [Candidatus Nanobsidianus stetteri]
MVKTLDEKIEEAKRKIITTESKYEDYATAIRHAYEQIREVDQESIPLLWNLIKTMEKFSTFDIELKEFILSNIRKVASYVELYPYFKERIIQNLRRGIEILTNEEGLLKMNELYSLILDGKIPLQNFDKYLKEVHDWAYRNNLKWDQETKIKYARQKGAYEYIGVIIKGLLMDPTKYEPLYKQLIETYDLEKFVEHLQKEYEKLIPKKDVTF